TPVPAWVNACVARVRPFCAGQCEVHCQLTDDCQMADILRLTASRRHPSCTEKSSRGRDGDERVEVAKRRRRIHVPGQNALLTALPEKELQRLVPRLETVSMHVRDLAHEAHQPIPDIYFPLSGVISLVLVMADGLTTEIATIGNEGMIGLSVY